MDKFTKTTEIEISNMNSFEEEAPQKSKVGKVIAIIISLLLALVAWIYVTETDETEVEKEFKNIKVVVQNQSEQFNITADNVSVTLIGTNSQLVDVDSNDIVIYVDALSKRPGDATSYYVTTNDISYNGKSEVKVKETSIDVHITIEEKNK